MRHNQSEALPRSENGKYLHSLSLPLRLAPPNVNYINQIQGLLNMTTKIQDLFKTVRTMMIAYSLPSQAFSFSFFLLLATQEAAESSSSLSAAPRRFTLLCKKRYKPQFNGKFLQDKFNNNDKRDSIDCSNDYYFVQVFDQ